MKKIAQLDVNICRKARLSKDPRFDGKFFTAVKTTQIYCRSICPAVPPKEENVLYYATAIEAAQAGYRPCLRCRPDSAPGSAAWKGVNNTFEHALNLINTGALEEGSIQQLAERVGISTRYLRQLFTKYLGVSPKSYALYKQCLFAKQLLHQTQLPITQIAQASGFNSIRRFNDCFQSQLKLTPSEVRQSTTETSNTLQLHLYYRPPYNWKVMSKFLSARSIDNIEWCDTKSYGRTFDWKGCTGNFTAHHFPDENKFKINIFLTDTLYLKSIVSNIRRILDLDADSHLIDRNLKDYFTHTTFNTGIRIPGTWCLFEAGIRAILGQQITVSAAQNVLKTLIESCHNTYEGHYLFPKPELILDNSLSQLKIPNARKRTLKYFSEYYMQYETKKDPEYWLSIKGIGEWTINYAKLRGLSDPNIYLKTDVGVKKAIQKLSLNTEFKSVSPWYSYLTLQLWSQL